MQEPTEKCFKWRGSANAGENMLKYFRGKEALDLSGGTLSCLNVSLLPELLALDAQKSQLTALLTGVGSRLRLLNLAGSLITELGTRGLRDLRTLIVSDTAICQLNTTFIGQLETLEIANTAIYYVDLRNLAKLRRFIANSNIKMLDLSKCKEIRSLALGGALVQRICVCGYKRLEKLYVRGAVIKYLDFRQKWAVQLLVKDAHYVIIYNSNE